MIHEVLGVDFMSQERSQIGRGNTMAVWSPGNQGRNTFLERQKTMI